MPVQISMIPLSMPGLANSVRFGPPNQLPGASAGDDIVITMPENSIELQGIASDADGTVATYLWSQQSRPANAILSGRNTATLHAADLAEGVYLFRNLWLSETEIGFVPFGILNMPILNLNIIQRSLATSEEYGLRFGESKETS